VVIDFGLAYHSQLAEDKAVDLYVLERALSSTHPNSESFFQLIMRAYEQTSKHSKLTLQVLKKVRARGRKRVMLG
jgi:TP53 regulating kinase-like protein